MNFVLFTAIGLVVLAIAYVAVASTLASIFMRASQQMEDIDWAED